MTSPAHPRRRALPAALAVLLLAGALVAGVVPGPGRVPAAHADAPAPAWWDGDCDTNHWTAAARATGWTGAAAHRLGGVVLGVPVCGPGSIAHAPDVWWKRAGWGELEWECVEFAQRFMIQIYGVSPYQANGVDVVNHYTTAQGGNLVKVTNGTTGQPPMPGDVVSFSSPTNSAGHVAVVASTAVDAAGNGSVRLATQNDTADGWRTLAVTNWRLAAFGSLTPYGWLHDPAGRGGTAGPPPEPVVDEGTYVQHGAQVFRIAGGAPVYVDDWGHVGGVQPVVVVDDARWSTLRATPRDGTFLRDHGTGAVFRVAGGAPLPVRSCTAAGMNGCAGVVDVDGDAVRNAGRAAPWDALRTTVADGTFVRVGDDGAPGFGTLYRAAGGALLPLPDCDAVGGCNPWTTLEVRTVSDYRAARPVPLDGTVIRLQPAGTLAVWQDGTCTAAPAGTGWPWVDVDAVGSATCALPLAVGALDDHPQPVLGRAFSLAVPVSGGTAPYRFTATRLPAGLALSAAGVVSGTPTRAGTTTVTVRVRDAGTPVRRARVTITFVVTTP